MEQIGGSLGVVAHDSLARLEPVSLSKPSSRDLSYRIAASRLQGVVQVSGAKNSALRLLAASLLTGEPVEVANYPATLLDAQVHLGMLEALGKHCVVTGDTIVISEAKKPVSVLEWSGRSIRNTLLILGALVARTGAGESFQRCILRGDAFGLKPESGHPSSHAGWAARVYPALSTLSASPAPWAAFW